MFHRKHAPGSTAHQLIAFAALLVLGLVGATGATAQEAGELDAPEAHISEYSRAGFYAWAGAGTAIKVRTQEFRGLPIQSATGINARVGFSSGIAAGEVQFEYLPDVSVERGSREIAAYDSLVGTLNAKLQGQVNRFQPYLLLGFGFSHLSAARGRGSSTDYALRAGAGTNIFITQHVAFSADVTYVYTGPSDNSGADYISIGYGLMYQF